MNKIILLTALAFAACITSAPLYAYTPGTVGGQILKFGTNAQPLGQGGAFCAVSDNPSAIYWNPAGLSSIKNKEISLTHMNNILDIRFVNLSYVHPLKRFGAIGINTLVLYANDSFRDVSGNFAGYFMNYNSYVNLAYGKPINSKLSAGIGLKYLYNQLNDYRTSNILLDLSGLYAMSNGLRLGLNVQNINTNINIQGDLESAPFNIKLGASKSFLKDRITVASDINVPIDANPYISIGVDYGIVNMLKIRCGYRYMMQENYLDSLFGLAAGFSFYIRNYQVDYAYTPYGKLGNNVHFLTMGIKL